MRRSAACCLKQCEKQIHKTLLFLKRSVRNTTFHNSAQPRVHRLRHCAHPLFQKQNKDKTLVCGKPREPAGHLGDEPCCQRWEGEHRKPVRTRRAAEASVGTATFSTLRSPVSPGVVGGALPSALPPTPSPGTGSGWPSPSGSAAPSVQTTKGRLEGLGSESPSLEPPPA